MPFLNQNKVNSCLLDYKPIIAHNHLLLQVYIVLIVMFFVVILTALFGLRLKNNQGYHVNPWEAFSTVSEEIERLPLLNISPLNQSFQDCMMRSYLPGKICRIRSGYLHKMLFYFTLSLESTVISDYQ